VKRAREIAVAVAGVVALAVGAFLVSPRAPAPGAPAAGPARAFPGSTFDTGPHGARALYRLLEALGHQVERRASPSAAVSDERVRIVLGPGAPPDPATLAWVARGNTLVLAPPPPGTTVGERPHGSGRVVALPSAEALENAALRRDPVPAVSVAALCAAYAYGGRVVFDESPRAAGALLASLARYPVGVALLQALVAVLLLAWARAPRFGPALAAGAPAAPEDGGRGPDGNGPRQSASEQVAAAADLYEAAGAATLAARVLRAHFRQRAVRALGLAPAVDDAALAGRHCRRFGGDPQHLAAVLAAAADPRLRAGELPRVARALYEHEQRMERSHGQHGQ
jgi:hypothetical protein